MKWILEIYEHGSYLYEYESVFWMFCNFRIEGNILDFVSWWNFIKYAWLQENTCFTSQDYKLAIQKPVSCEGLSQHAAAAIFFFPICCSLLSCLHEHNIN
jgi:hypothetical protein